MKENFQKYCTEFIGTFFLVFTVGCTLLLDNPGVIPAIAIGFALMIMVYAGGHISGGHYNPAVSLAASLRGALPFSRLIQYWFSQFGGAYMAAVVIGKLLPYVNNVPNNSFNLINLAIGEFLFTFALCYVVLLSAMTTKTEGNSYFGLAIGSTVTVGAFAVGGICLAAFNPAVAIGVGVLHMAPWSIIGITIMANLIAAIAATGVYGLITNE